VKTIQPNDIIDLWNFCYRLGVHLRITTSHDDPGGRVVPFSATGELAALGVGLIGNSTTVNDVNVRCLGKWHECVPCRLESIFDRGGIVLINLTAEGGNRYT